ncbi:SAM domain and HD domain-containing protein 1 [Thecamonas trahens ATCC 50062]|uniref:SAM domain and HD domain-containing protein 1 n=1 Tax=Thecamonas trahens ATCC 50062 TaxID=461836 RepID=A0A0L0DTA6_THETB|nr:SAM domain and HD domain-containing protein 1 [Thecamonas trahens ATCC 50062]KNC55505.1 SAM domain and HD domain-containing protein 1 [Thecamonas trahens ATCC 50062]|eukprot:XP_013761285.1 SAM domain and HD domain-containing protein 1 [Thecamonas trahens ATCC 50062]
MSQPVDARGKAGKILNDPIHGHMHFSAKLMAVVDTPQFQRLRELKQLGSTYFVFPGASHNRFEHSLGVSHLAGKLVRTLASKQPELGIDDRDIFLVELSGLCHDLGHGPFSHAFEKIINNLEPDLGFHHENMSQAIFRDIMDEHDLYDELDMTDEDVASVLQLISGVKDEAAKREKPFLYDIVANARNGIDVDKLDYLARDAYNVGVKSTYDFERLFSFCKVIDGEICFYVKEAFNLYQMFHTRYSLHKQVYTHKTSCAIEFMIQDILKGAYSYLKLADAIADGGVKAYLRLTDSILRTVENATEAERAADKGLATAHAILTRLHCRQLYAFVDQIVLPPHATSTIPTVDDIMAHHSTSFINLDPADVIVDVFKLNYSKKDENPVDFVHFYTHFESEDKITIAADKVSQLIPSSFQEVGIRIFLRTRASDSMYAARTAFRSWCRAMKTTSPFPSGPVLTRQPSAAASSSTATAVAAARASQASSITSTLSSSILSLDDDDDDDDDTFPTSPSTRRDPPSAFGKFAPGPLKRQKTL